MRNAVHFPDNDMCRRLFPKEIHVLNIIRLIFLFSRLNLFYGRNVFGFLTCGILRSQTDRGRFCEKLERSGGFGFLQFFSVVNAL